MNHKAIDIAAVPRDFPTASVDIFNKLDLSHITLSNRTLSWALEINPLSSDKATLLQQIEDYNCFIARLEYTESFLSTFIQNGYAITRKEIIEKWSSDLAEHVFSLKNYPFDTPLAIMGDTLFASALAPRYEITIDSSTISFAVGESDDGYPKGDDQCRFLWNWYDDYRDFTFYLYEIFADNDLISDEVDENGDTLFDYGDYEAYDQARELMDKPNANLLSCMDILIEAGYLTLYRIESDRKSPWFLTRGAIGGTIGFALLQMEFLNQESLKSKLANILTGI